MNHAQCPFECPGTPEAAKFLKREYRKGWELV
jgi:hypothetical protein